MTDPLYDPLLDPSQWPFLERLSPDQLARVCRTVVLTPAGRALMNNLVLVYLLDDPPEGLSAKERLGREDVVRHLLQMVGFGTFQELSDGRSNASTE